jgi:hypothetical protein
MKRRNDGIDVEGKAPSFQFYPQDFERDMQILSLAAQGLWSRMLGWMHFNRPNRGFLELPTGEPMTEEDIAAKIGKPLEEVSRCLAEMKRHGVFSMDERECIYNRRMVKDTDISKKRAAAAKARAESADRNGDGEFCTSKLPAKPEQSTVLSLSSSSSYSSSFSPNGKEEPPAREKVTELPKINSEPTYVRFKALAVQYGMQVSDVEWRDFERWTWARLDWSQKHGCITGLEARIKAQDFTLRDSTPKNYAEKRLYERRVREPPAAPQQRHANPLVEKALLQKEHRERILGKP